MIYNAYQSKQIIAICALDSAHEKFDAWNEVTPSNLIHEWT